MKHLHNALQLGLRLAPTCSMTAALTLAFLPAQQTTRAAQAHAGLSNALLVRVQALQALLEGVRVEDDRMIFEGLNLHVRNGGGPNVSDGHGNLVLGFDEASFDGGSHNVVVGSIHTYTNRRCLVTGRGNRGEGLEATLLGGELNRVTATSGVTVGGTNLRASQNYAAALGGAGSDAAAPTSVVAGGLRGLTSDLGATVMGGADSEASGFCSSVRGGIVNSATGDYATVLGGTSNVSSTTWATVAGGQGGRAEGFRSTVVGGRNVSVLSDTAVGCGGSDHSALLGSDFSTIVGGRNLQAFGQEGVLVGGENNVLDPGSQYGSMIGGLQNRVGGFAASNSGGANRWVTATWGWVAGSLFEQE